MTPWKAQEVRERAAEALSAQGCTEDLSACFGSTVTPAFCKAVPSQGVLEENAEMQGCEGITSRPILAAFPSWYLWEWHDDFRNLWSPCQSLSWCKPWIQVSVASGLGKLFAFCPQSRIWQFGVSLEGGLALCWHEEYSQLLYLEQVPSVTLRPQQWEEIESLVCQG